MGIRYVKKICCQDSGLTIGVRTRTSKGISTAEAIAAGVRDVASKMQMGRRCSNASRRIPCAASGRKWWNDANMVRMPPNSAGTLVASTGFGQYRIEGAKSARNSALGYRSVRVTRVLNPRSASFFTTRATGPPDPDPRSTISVTSTEFISFESCPAHSWGNGVIP